MMNTEISILPIYSSVVSVTPPPISFRDTGRGQVSPKMVCRSGSVDRMIRLQVFTWEPIELSTLNIRRVLFRLPESLS